MISEQKIKEWVEIYLSHIKEITPEVHVREEEGYKFKSVDTFQKNFNLDALNFAEMLNHSVEDNNLTAGNMYFPRKMLMIFAEKQPEETRKILRDLFDASKSISARINEAEREFDGLMKKRNSELGEEANSFINLRFISLLLGFRFPKECNAMKPREWKVFSKYVDDDFIIPNGTSSGERYEILSRYVDAVRKHIASIPEISDLREQLTRGLSITDETFHWMAQDIIYVTARVLVQKKSGEAVQKETQQEPTINTSEDLDDEVATISAGMEFPLEAYLENLMVQNWDSINLGESLKLFVDEDGVNGQQYTTDIGIIDILTKDVNGNFVVIELKKGRTSQKVVGQILSYMGWVRANLATNGQKVRGIIIAADGTDALLSARSEVSDKVDIKYYRIRLDFVDPGKK